jgi:argininosuccinate lyase
LADYLVNQGVPFREAHFITGRAVAKSEELGVDLSELPEAELMALDTHIKNDVTPFLNLRNSMNSRKSEGGTAAERVLEQITYFENFIKEHRN